MCEQNLYPGESQLWEVGTDVGTENVGESSSPTSMAAASFLGHQGGRDTHQEVGQ